MYIYIGLWPWILTQGSWVPYKFLSDELTGGGLVPKSCLTLWDPMDGQAPLSVRFLRQEYWSGLPFPSPGNLPDLQIEPTSPALAGRFFTTEQPGKPHIL